MQQKKSWTERLESCKPREVKPAPIDIAGMKAGQLMLVPSAEIVDDFIRSISKGASMDVRTLKAALALKYGAEVTCPITTGFHLRTVAEAAFEAHEKGASLSKITPFWRVLDENTPTAERLACGAEFIKRMRAREGLPPAKSRATRPRPRSS
ncbi:MAG: hypothetical protein ACREDR_00750 [Blastocatellia bacterium]